jgi:hypothetical protein
MVRILRLLLVFAVIAAALELANVKLGEGEPHCGQLGTFHWCVKAPDVVVFPR